MSYEQVLEITKFIRKIGKRFDIFFDLKKLSDWAEEFLECDLRDLKASGELLMRDPMRRPTPAIILQCAATSKARRLSEEREETRRREWDELEREKTAPIDFEKLKREVSVVEVPRSVNAEVQVTPCPKAFEDRIRKGLLKLVYLRGSPRKDFINSFVSEMRRDFPNHELPPEISSFEMKLN